MVTTTLPPRPRSRTHNLTRDDVIGLREEVNQRFERVDQRLAEMTEQIDHDFALVEFEAQAAGRRRVIELLQDPGCREP